MLRIFLVLATLLVSQPAISQQFRGGAAEDYREIQLFHDRAVAKNNAGDVSGALRDYLPRLRVLNTGRTNIDGREHLAANWSAQRDRPVLISEIQEMELNGNEVGDWAYMICRYAYVALDRDTGEQTSEYADGRYIALLEKTTEGWKVLLDIDNGAAGAAPDLVERLRLQVSQ